VLIRTKRETCQDKRISHFHAVIYADVRYSRHL